MARILNSADTDFQEAFAALLDAKRAEEADVADIVSDIIRDVRRRGDEALYELTEKFDRFDVRGVGLAVTADDVEQAKARVPAEVLEAMQLAADRIRAYHERQLPSDETYVDDIGVELGHRWTPVDAAGLYVPGGLAAYPSSVLMNAIPARVAGVKRLVMVVPTPEGRFNDLVLAAADAAGVDEIWRIGGAQAVAALAWGTESIRPVDVIVGPGNAFVAEAKRQVFGKVGIDMIAGPSEVLAIADDSADPEWLAADLLAQAEHDRSAQSILVTTDAALAEAVARAVERQLETLPKADIAGESWEKHGAIIIVKDMDEAAAVSDAFAPEHLELSVRDPDALLAKVRHAGAIFIGHHTPEAVGDYLAGPNHVLPTSRSARFSSGLNVLNFMKRTTLLRCSPESLRIIGPAAVTLAEVEGLEAHARSVARRLGQQRG